jgi:superfamily I DNA/RNA helicase
MAYFRLAVSPDDDLAFERVVNLPKRGLGDTAQSQINQRPARRRCHCWTARGRLWPRA